MRALRKITEGEETEANQRVEKLLAGGGTGGGPQQGEAGCTWALRRFRARIIGQGRLGGTKRAPVSGEAVGGGRGACFGADSNGGKIREVETRQPFVAVAGTEPGLPERVKVNSRENIRARGNFVVKVLVLWGASFLGRC